MYSFNILFKISNNGSHSKHGNILINYDTIFKALNVLTKKVHDLIRYYGYYNIKFEINGIDITDKNLIKFDVDEEQMLNRFEYVRHILIAKLKIRELVLENKENYKVFSLTQYCKFNNIKKDILKNWIIKNNLYFFDNNNFFISEQLFSKYDKIIKIGVKVNFDFKNSEYTKFRNTELDKYIKNKLEHCDPKLENDEFKISIEKKYTYFKLNENKFKSFSLQELIQEFNKEENDFAVFKNNDNSTIKNQRNSVTYIKQDNGNWGSKNSVKTVNPRPHPY